MPVPQVTTVIASRRCSSAVDAAAASAAARCCCSAAVDRADGGSVQTASISGVRSPIGSVPSMQSGSDSLAREASLQAERAAASRAAVRMAL